MTTHSYISPIKHSTTDDFREWGQTLSNAFQTAGMVKTTDTGQINWATVLKPAQNTIGGFEIFRMNDALQASAPLFFKIEYGTANTSSLNYPNIMISVGTGTDGAGALTGLVSDRLSVVGTTTGSSGGLPNTVDSFATLVCVKDGFFGVAFKLGAAYGGEPNAVAYWMLGRTADDNGVETSEGAYLISRTGSTTTTARGMLQYLNFGAGTKTARSPDFCMIPGSVGTTAVGADFQAFKCYAMTPRMRPVLHVVHMLNSEYPVNTAFNARPLGPTDRNYISLGSGATYTGSPNNINHTLAMLWE